MNIKKLLAGILSVTMLASATAAFAAAPSEYDGQAYPAGVESNDPDGEINLAVIANGDVKIYGDTMYIEGSVYSNGTIYGGNGDGNVIKGVFISGTENQTETGEADAVAIRYGYVHVDDDGNTDVTNAYSTGLQHEGAILDKATSFDYTYTPYTYPEIANYVESAEANQWGTVTTVSEDTHFGTVTASGAGLIIDATAGDVTVVIDTLQVNGNNPYIQVAGSHHVNLYVKNWVQNGIVNLELASSDGDINNWDTVDQWANIQNSIYAADANGIPRPNNAVLDELNPNQIDFYIDTESGAVTFQGARIAANIHSNASSISFGNNLEIYGDIESGAATFETVGSGYINGTVLVPYAASTIHGSSCIQGQLITDTLLINGAGAILNQTDTISLADTTVPTEPSEPKSIYLDIIEDVIYITPGGTANITLDHNTKYEWNWEGVDYQWEFQDGKFTDSAGNVENPYWDAQEFTDTAWTATPSNSYNGREYILKAVSIEDGTVYDTVKIIVVDEIPTPTPTPEPEVTPSGGEIDLYGLGYAYIFGYEPGAPDENGYTPIEMAPNDSVTREQVAAMLMRMIDQQNNTKNASYALTDNIAQHDGTWYVRGLAYLASKGTFDGIDSVEVGPITRGEVAKLVVYGLNLSKTTETAFTDVNGTPYEKYIKIMAAYGYMNGISDTEFEPERIMTRAEFCKMFNNIIGREEKGLVAVDGHTVTADDYSIVDIDGHWAYSTILKATSAYNDEGYVDFTIRQENIRNKADHYDSQLIY